MAAESYLRLGNKRSKKILVVAPRVPSSLLGGDLLRIGRIIEAVSRDHEVHVAALCTHNPPRQTSPRLREWITHQEVFRQRPYASLLRVAAALVTGRSLQMAYFKNRELSRFVEKESEYYDLLLFHTIRSAQFAPERLGPPRILELTDAISLSYRRAEEKLRLSQPLAWAYWIETERAAQAERINVPRFDHVVLVSQADLNYLRKDVVDYSFSGSVIPNGVDTEELPYQFAPGSTDLAFIGNMRALHNVDACLFFAEEIAPLLGGLGVETHLNVIGNTPGRVRRLLERKPGIRVIGRVDDVATAAAGNAIGFCGTRLGSGLQNKILEYMALGLPTVASQIAVDGLPHEAQGLVAAADTPEDFATVIRDLLGDADGRRDLALAARRFVESQLSWDVIQEQYRELVRQLVS